MHLELDESLLRGWLYRFLHFFLMILMNARILGLTFSYFNLFMISRCYPDGENFFHALAFFERGGIVYAIY